MIPLIELKNGIKIPQLGFGTWELTGEECKTALTNALDLGYTHIDTADFYGNHHVISQVIKNYDRSKLFITTKVWRDYLRYDDVLEACDRFLKELQTDYIDLLLIHWPNKNIPISETLKAMELLYTERKIRSVGVSNFTVNHLKDALKVTNIPITINQVEFHPMLYQKKLLKFCIDNKIKLTAYSPLGRGKVFDNLIIQKIADKYNKTPAQISLRWMIQKGIIVIPKASTFKHIKQNMEIFDFKIEKEDRLELNNLEQKRLIDPGISEFDY